MVRADGPVAPQRRRASHQINRSGNKFGSNFVLWPIIVEVEGGNPFIKSVLYHKINMKSRRNIKYNEGYKTTMA